MKYLLAIVLLLAGCATTNNNLYIRTSGEGDTFEQAKNAAFREAVQIKVGAVVLSERLHNINRTVQDDITVHSSGYVDDYKLINTTNNKGTYRVTVDVLVAESKLANQILHTAKAEKNFAGDRASTAYGTYLSHTQDADKLVSHVMSGYPKHAFILEQGNYVLGVDRFRKGKLSVPFNIKWNKDYLVAVDEVAKRFEDKRSLVNRVFTQPLNTVTIEGKSNKYFEQNSKYEIIDQTLLTTMISSMRGINEMRIRTDVYDGNHTSMQTTCIVPWWHNYGKQFFSTNSYNSIWFDGNLERGGEVTFDVNQHNMHIFAKAVSIELSIVSLKDCPRI